MKKLFFLLCLSTTQLMAQSLQDYVDKGVKLYDEGKYEDAVSQYKKALDLDPKSALANYEIALTYFALEKYDKAVEHTDNVLNAKTDYMNQAYVLKGSAQDNLGKPKEAVKTYKAAIKAFPEDHLLRYNLALTYYNQKEAKDAEEAIIEALKLKSHPSSHLLLGIIMEEKGNKAQAMLAYYNFLLLEPKGKRATSAYGMLEGLMKKGVSKTGDNNTTITMSSDNKVSDEFRAAELMVALLEASKSLEENKGKTDNEMFAKNTKSFFDVLGEMKNKNKGFWWRYYVDFFYAMSQAGHTDAFSYYISQSKSDEEVKTWLDKNKDKIEAFGKWYQGQERKY